MACLVTTCFMKLKIWGKVLHCHNPQCYFISSCKWVCESYHWEFMKEWDMFINTIQTPILCPTLGLEVVRNDRVAMTLWMNNSQQCLKMPHILLLPLKQCWPYWGHSLADVMIPPHLALKILLAIANNTLGLLMLLCAQSTSLCS